MFAKKTRNYELAMQGPLREPLTPEQGFALCGAMYEHARSLGVFLPADPLEGLEAKIAMARALNLLPPVDGGTGKLHTMERVAGKE